MQIKEIVIGDVLTMTEGGGEYLVVRINGDKIYLEHTLLCVGMDVYLSDMPEMFMGVCA